MTTGRCLCGAVRFEVDASLRGIVVCHCSLCRRAGTYAGAYTWVPDRSAVRVSDRSSLSVHIDVNGRERSFCGTCGSLLFWAVPGAEGVSVSAGALDTDAGLRIVRHIHVDSSAPWEPAPGGVPAHRAGSASPLVADGGGE